MSGKITPELRLKKLRRLEHNIICPNCGTSAPQGLGFGNVCVKFNTFICDLCKTSHQAISHRVKSITMSNWTHDEINALTAEFGGGNEAALHIWLQNAPAYGGKYRGGSRPKEGDRIDIFKNFVSDCYDKGMFRATTPFVPNTTTTTTTSNTTQAPVVKKTNTTATNNTTTTANNTTAPVIAKPTTVDFFDTDFTTNTSSVYNSNTSGVYNNSVYSTDPFSSGGTFGDASPKPPSHTTSSNYSSTTDLLSAGAVNSTSGVYGNSSVGSGSGVYGTSGVAVPKQPTHSDFLFDAFADTPTTTPSNTTYNNTTNANTTNSGFDFIAGDPFNTTSNNTGSSGVYNNTSNNNTFATFDNFNNSNSNNSSANSNSSGGNSGSNSNAASGFDFMVSSTDPFAGHAPRSNGSSITTNFNNNSNFNSNFNSTTNSNTNSNANSAYTSNSDLFAFSNTATTNANNTSANNHSSAVAALTAPSPVPSPLQVPQHAHDPFGSVFLQPTLTGSSTGGVSPVSPYTPQSVSSVGSGTLSGASGPSARTGMGSTGGLSGPVNGTGLGGGMHMNGIRGVSPVPGIGYGGVGGGMGQPYPPTAPYRPAQSFGSGPSFGAPSSRTPDPIGDAFGNLGISAPGQGYRGASPSYPQQYQHSSSGGGSSSNFDFVQSTVKQQLPPAQARAGGMGSGMSSGSGMSGGMGGGSGMGGGYQQYQYPPQR